MPLLHSQNILFGSFSEEDVVELYQNKTSDLRFAWQERAPSTKRCALYGNSLAPLVATSQGGHMLGTLSPNIPPNPPTSPVDATYDLSSRGGLPSKLNVNAVPFVPGERIGAGAINSLDVAKNSTARQLNFTHSDDAQGQPESERTLSGALEKLKIEDQPNVPGVVIQTVGEPSCDMGSESNSRVGNESDSHSRTDPHLNAAQQNSISEREQSPAELSLDLSSTTQQLENSQRTQPNSTDIRSGSPSHSVSSSDTERHHDVIPNTAATRQATTALPTNQTASSSDHRRSHTHSPTPTPTSPPPHSHTPTPSQSNDKPRSSRASSSSASDQEKLRSQEASQQQQQQQQASVAQPSSQSCSPGSVSSLSSASLSSTVPSTAGSTASGSGGVKVKSWASIVSKKASTGQPAALQGSQNSLTGSPQVHAASGGGRSRTSSGDHMTAVATATDSQVQSREDAAQQQMPPLNPAKAQAQLANLGSELICITYL